MGPEVKSKKRKSVVPDDEVIKAKKVKQIEADILPKEIKSTHVPDLTAEKKRKASKSDPVEGDQSMSADQRISTRAGNQTVNDTEGISKKLKLSNGTRKIEKRLREGQSGNKLDNDREDVIKRDLKTSIPDDEHEEISASSESEADDVDDQTDALLRGFESDDDNLTSSEEQGYLAGDDIPNIGKKIRRKVKAAEKASTSGKPGVVYIGRIPHGFYEQEMRQYFSQFGSITNLRLSRNRKTGKSKHFAFVEFESAEVAEIVSKTMDNYLLFGHILKCKLVEPEQIHRNLWTGANKRFKTVPWNKIQGRKLAQPMTVAVWERRMEREEKRRAEKKEAMKLIGYEFESPNLKSARETLKTKPELNKLIGHEPDKDGLNEIEAGGTLDDEREDQLILAKPSKGLAPALNKKRQKSNEAELSDELFSSVDVKKSASTDDIDGATAEKAAKAKKKNRRAA